MICRPVVISVASGFVVASDGGGDSGDVFVVCEQAYARKKQLLSFGIHFIY